MTGAMERDAAGRVQRLRRRSRLAWMERAGEAGSGTARRPGHTADVAASDTEGAEGEGGARGRDDRGRAEGGDCGVVGGYSVFGGAFSLHGKVVGSEVCGGSAAQVDRADGASVHSVLSKSTGAEYRATCARVSPRSS